MTAPAISHLLGTIGFIVLIFFLPLFYFNIVENIQTDVALRELKEVADYSSNTVGNLYFLVNSTNSDYISMEKELIYFPTEVENSIYILEIKSNVTTGEAEYVSAKLKNDDSVEAISWLLPGLKIIESQDLVESTQETIFIGCSRNATGVYLWLR
jgi:hypothetical protein